MEAGSVLYLYNSGSGRGRAGVGAEAVCAVFRRAGCETEAVKLDFSTNPFEGRETPDLVVTAGGDGTVNYVINCMKRSGLDIPIGVIPAGTANDFAGAIGMSRRPLVAARQIVGGHVERVDCGRVNDHYFVNVFSFGIFTTTSQRTSDESKQRLGRLAYLLEGAKELRSIHDVPLRVTADGGTFETSVYMALVFNGETAGGFRLAPEASIRDGLFDCLLLERQPGVQPVLAMAEYLMGGRSRAVRHLRAARLDIVSPADEPTDADGQCAPRFPLRIECLRGGLRVVCPAAGGAGCVFSE